MFNVRDWQWLKVMINYKVGRSIGAYVNESTAKWVTKFKVHLPSFKGHLCSSFLQEMSSDRV